MKREARPIRRPLSDSDRARYRGLRAELDQERDDIVAQGRRFKAARDATAAELRHAVQLLKAERLAQGLSLADVEERTGLGKSALSRLETDPDANPTLATLARYAEALGKQLAVSLHDPAAD
ncbi:MAG TPA: helix-turn-helix transcriptional regulator [Planctomycetaceae bacterium]|nr:helix-turn-helix transcriptional regulator [Planctomycetaceae bacterium]